MVLENNFLKKIGHMMRFDDFLDRYEMGLYAKPIYNHPWWDLGKQKIKSMAILFQGAARSDNGYSKPYGLFLSYLVFWHTLYLEIYSFISSLIVVG